jgi:hypothetical protein
VEKVCRDVKMTVVLKVERVGRSKDCTYKGKPKTGTAVPCPYELGLQIRALRRLGNLEAGWTGG